MLSVFNRTKYKAIFFQSWCTIPKRKEGTLWNALMMCKALTLNQMLSKTTYQKMTTWRRGLMRREKSVGKNFLKQVTLVTSFFNSYKKNLSILEMFVLICSHQTTLKIPSCQVAEVLKDNTPLLKM